MPPKSRLWLPLLAIAAAMAALVSACRDSADKAGQPSAENMAPVQELRLNLAGEPQSLDPGLVADGVSIGVVRQLYRGLLTFDESLSLVPAVAEEVPTESNGGVSADGLTYTFSLRRDVTWSDGQPVTARDFEYSIKRLLDPRTGSYYTPMYFDIRGAMEYAMAFGDPQDPQPVDDATLAQLSEGIGIRAVDDYTLEISLVQPRYTFAYLMAIWPAYPLREDVVSQGPDWTEPGKIVTNGPFLLREWAHNDHITLAPNPNWYGDQPKLTKVTLKMIADPNAAYAAYLNNELDAVVVPPPNVKAVESDTGLSEQVVRSTDLATFTYQFNAHSAPFDDPKVRQAFAMAFDRQAFVDKVQFGVGEVAYSLIPPGMPGYDSETGQEWSYDPERAKQLLTEAGYASDAMPDVTIPFPDVGANRLWAEFAQGQFEENLGVNVELQPLEPRAFVATVMQGQFMIVPVGLGVDYPDPDGYLPQNFSSQGGNNLAGYSNAEFDALVQQAIAEPDPEKRLALWSEAQQLLVADAAAIFVSYPERLRLVKPYVRDLVLSPMDAGLDGELFLTRTYIVEH